VKEITGGSSEAVRKILEAGIPVSNQSVLLKNVNDNAAVITELCHGLLKIGVRPYYLYRCDPAKGVTHFQTSISKGVEIIEKMRGHTTGLAVPTYVVDAVKGGGKIPIQPDYIAKRDGNNIVLRNYEYKHYEYEDEALK
jgi:lysine 2,3-aminomutase